MKIPPLLEIPRISIGAGLAAILLVLALTAVYVMVPAQHQGAVIFFGAGIASAAAIATAFYTAKTLHIAHVRHEREPQEAAARFAERWNDAAMFHVRTACQEIMEMRNRNRDDVKAKIESNPQSRNNILHILNFLEELGMAIRAGRADHPYSKRLFAGIVINVDHVLQYWIEEERVRRGRPELWVELRWLYQRWCEGEN